MELNEITVEMLEGKTSEDITEFVKERGWILKLYGTKAQRIAKVMAKVAELRGVAENEQVKVKKDVAPVEIEGPRDVDATTRELDEIANNATVNRRSMPLTELKGTSTIAQKQKIERVAKALGNRCVGIDRDSKELVEMTPAQGGKYANDPNGYYLMFGPFIKARDYAEKTFKLAKEGGKNVMVEGDALFYCPADIRQQRTALAEKTSRDMLQDGPKEDKALNELSTGEKTTTATVKGDDAADKVLAALNKAE